MIYKYCLISSNLAELLKIVKSHFIVLQLIEPSSVGECSVRILPKAYFYFIMLVLHRFVIVYSLNSVTINVTYIYVCIHQALSRNYLTFRTAILFINCLHVQYLTFVVICFLICEQTYVSIIT